MMNAILERIGALRLVPVVKIESSKDAVHCRLPKLRFGPPPLKGPSGP